MTVKLIRFNIKRISSTIDTTGDIESITATEVGIFDTDYIPQIGEIIVYNWRPYIVKSVRRFISKTSPRRQEDEYCKVIVTNYDLKPKSSTYHENIQDVIEPMYYIDYNGNTKLIEWEK